LRCFEVFSVSFLQAEVYWGKHTAENDGENQGLGRGGVDAVRKLRS